jgi:flagellar protein FliS
MAMIDAYQKYREQEVYMANPAALVVMLYNGCIKQLKLAQLAIDKKNYEETNGRLQKARNIISELVSSLDLKYPISKDLLALYDFMLREIRLSNVSKDRTKIDPLIQMLSSLRDAWAQAEKTCRTPYDLSEQ